MVTRVKQPVPSDLKSNTVKAAGITALLSAVVAFIQFLGSFDVVTEQFVQQVLKTFPYATIFLSYLVALFRKNLKAQL